MKTATRQKTASSAKSRRKLRDLDERDPSKVKGGMTATNTSPSKTAGGYSVGTGRTIVPCV